MPNAKMTPVTLLIKTTTPPIPDANGNGYFDAEDITTQLWREEDGAAMRTTTERAHGVLEVIGIRKASEQVFASVERYGLDSSDIPQAKRFLAEQIVEKVAFSKDAQATIPNYREALTRDVTEQLAKAGHSFEDIAITLADQHNFADFAQTFDKTFPKGVKLVDTRTVDLLEILGHFKPAAEPTQSTEKKPGGQAL